MTARGYLSGLSGYPSPGGRKGPERPRDN